MRPHIDMCMGACMGRFGSNLWTSLAAVAAVAARRFQNLNWDAEIGNLMEGEESLYESVTQGQLFWEREGPQRPGRRTDG